MPILWLHAYPYGPLMWEPQLARFGGVAPDLLAPGTRSVEEMADRALDAADKARLDRFVVVGCSLGGYVAFDLVARAPGRALALVLVGTRAEPDTDEMRRKRAAQALDLRTRGPGSALPLVGAQLGPFARDDAKLRRRLTDIVRDRDPEALAGALEAMGARPDARPLLPRIACPTLVVVGAEDTVIPPASGHAIAEAIPGARLVEIDGCGHLPNLEDSALFDATLREFLQAADEQFASV